MNVERHAGRRVAIAVALLGTQLLHAAEPRDDRRLADAVAAIVRADYRGDRAELARQGEALAAAPSRRNAAYREYWTGFAFWRRAINGFNETPALADLMSDLERCARHERAALALDAGLEDARGALCGCLGGQLFLGSQLAHEKRAAVVEELLAAFKVVERMADGNPRSLWIVGGFQAFSPRGADPARGAATYRRGLAAARAEALAVPREPWAPTWGAPELLMSLAYLNTAGPRPNKEVARAYAESALAMVPDWHYVRDVLLPQIEKLDAPAPGTAAGGE